jgi:hypothetical protein
VASVTLPSETRHLVRIVKIFVLSASLMIVLVAGSACAQKIRNGTGACLGEDVYAGQDLVAVAQAARAGTTFCINDGDYLVLSRIRVQDGDTFWGIYFDSTRPTISTDRAEHIFHTQGADNATIKNLTATGAVGGAYCQPNCGRAIGGGGNNLTVDNVRATENANQGIGGTGPGLVVKDSEIDNNGSDRFADIRGPVSSAGIKSVNSMTVENSYIHDNYWSGVWCDIECNAFEVRDSTLVRNGKSGIHDEISTGPAVFANNIIRDNGVPGRSTRLGGILIVGSSNVHALNNTFGGNTQGAMQVFSNGRKLLVSGVSIYNNNLNGDHLRGCDIKGVRCFHNDSEM